MTCTSPRNPAFTLALAAQHPATSLAEVKEQVARETGLALGKIKLLFGKKPVGDSKVLADLLSASSSSGSAAGGELELGVMVLGGGVLRDGFGTSTSTSASTSGQAQAQSEAAKVEGGQAKVEEEAAAAAAAAAPVAQGLSGEGVLATGEFWEDLKGFLQQRVRDEGVAGEALGVFRGAWEGRA